MTKGDSKFLCKPRQQKGFTLIELMLAAIIFAVVLVVILASFLQIGRIYYKGVSVAGTNEAARTAVDDITNDLRSSKDVTLPKQFTPDPTSPYWYFCVGTHKYAYKITLAVHQVTSYDINVPGHVDPNGLVKSDISNGCDSNFQTGSHFEQLLGANMQLNRLDFNCNSLNNVDSCSLTIRVVFFGSDPSVLKPSATDPNASCVGSLLSTDFCSVAFFSTDTITNF